jgi:Zn-dependent membrane protease YugP
MIFVISIVFMLLGLLVSRRLKSKFEKYSQIRLRNGMTGAEIAQRMLHDNGIYDVRIIQV